MTTKVMLTVIVVVLAVAGVASIARKPMQTFVSDNNGGEPAADAAQVPVLVELFTSEGCSSCPPADAFLARLEQGQPVAGAEVIALSEHVDYWNRLGWSDPYSSAAFSNRQNQYASAFNTDEVYTPQMIVDGRVQFTGSNESRARQAIADAVHNPKMNVAISAGSDTGQTSSAPLSIRVESNSQNIKDGSADVMLAITESGLRSSVTRGENAGRVLNHIDVVRTLSKLGEIDSRKSDVFTAQPVVQLNKAWKRESMKAVVFVQARGSCRVLGASVRRLSK